MIYIYIYKWYCLLYLWVLNINDKAKLGLMVTYMKNYQLLTVVDYIYPILYIHIYKLRISQTSPITHGDRQFLTYAIIRPIIALLSVFSTLITNIANSIININYIYKVGKGSLFNSYYTEVKGRALVKT